MATANFSSAINTGLPNTPNIANPELREQFQYVYQAIQILQVELSQLREEFDAYVLAHP